MLNEFFSKLKVPDFIRPQFELDDWYLQTGRYLSVLEEKFKASKIESKSDTLRTQGVVQIGVECSIGDYVVIHGPAYIGKNVTIAPHVFIRPGSIISDNCSISHASHIKNSLLMEESKIANQAMVGDSILGFKARLGGHAETMNRRYDQKKINFRYKDQKIETSYTKLGAIIGQNTRISGGVYLDPGTMVGKNCFVGVSLGGYVRPGQFITEVRELKAKPNKFKGEFHSRSNLSRLNNEY